MSWKPSRWKVVVAVSLAAACVAGAVAALPVWLGAGETRPGRGSVIAAVADSPELVWADVFGLLGVALVALVPVLQVARVVVSRSVAGLSLWAHASLLWVLVGGMAQGVADSDPFMTTNSVVGFVASVGVLWGFARLGGWSWLEFLGPSVLVAAAAILVRADGSWAASLMEVVGALAVAVPAAVLTLLALLTAESRRGVSIAVFVVATAGYGMWVAQGVVTADAVAAAVAAFLAIGNGAAFGVLLWLPADEVGRAEDAVLRRMVADLPRAVALHRPVVDEGGLLVDVELVWANAQWQKYRQEPLQAGGLASGERVRFDELLPYLRQAYTEGAAQQFFRLERARDNADIYIPDSVMWDATIEVETIFSMISDDRMLEWGDDLDAKIRLGSELEAQRREFEQRRLELGVEMSKRDEHARWARELHDSVLQDLYFANLTLERGLDKGGLDREQIGAVLDVSSRATTDIRRLISEEPREAGGGLVDRTVEMLRERAAAMENGPRLVLAAEQDESVYERVPAAVVADVLLIVGEAVSNACRHAAASRVEVGYVVDGDVDGSRLVVTVADDGQGFDPTVTRRSGVSNMETRAVGRGGEFTVESSDAGVVVRAVLPVVLTST